MFQITITIYATAKDATQSTSSSTAKTKGSALFIVDVPTITAAVGAAAAIGGVSWGIYQYRKGQVSQRQQVLFELVKELNTSPQLKLAKEILGYDYVKKPKEDWNHKAEPGYYSKQHLSEFLDPEKKHFEDCGQLEIRDSFDSFIVFLGKIGYSLKVGAIKRRELVYFHYYIQKTIETPEVTSYIERSKFPLYYVLLSEATVRIPKKVLRAYRHFAAADDITLAELMTTGLQKYVARRNIPRNIPKKRWFSG